MDDKGVRKGMDGQHGGKRGEVGRRGMSKRERVRGRWVGKGKMGG